MRSPMNHIFHFKQLEISFCNRCNLKCNFLSLLKIQNPYTWIGNYKKAFRIKYYRLKCDILKKGPSTKDIQVFGLFVDPPTHPSPINAVPWMLQHSDIWFLKTFPPTPKSDILSGCPLSSNMPAGCQNQSWIQKFFGGKN